MSLSENVKEKIRTLVEVYYDVQDVRIRTFNRLRQFGRIEGVDPHHLKKLEAEIRQYIWNEIKDLPIVEKFLKNIRGIGPVLAGGLVTLFDINKADRPSGFWHYAGLHVVNGKAPKRKRGKKLDYNPKAKVLCWKLGRSFLLCWLQTVVSGKWTTLLHCLFMYMPYVEISAGNLLAPYFDLTEEFSVTC